MPEIRGIAETTVTATADLTGTATAIINGPGWGYYEVDSIAVFVQPSPPIPQANLYQGSLAVGRAMASRRAGDRGTFRGTNDRLQAGQQYALQWTGCQPGATCTAVLRGNWVRNA